jgi:hypothetical protein
MLESSNFVGSVRKGWKDGWNINRKKFGRTINKWRWTEMYQKQIKKKGADRG